jgi:phosphoserine phosphatase
MATDILLARHGQTESNRLHINMGRSDEGLNTSGFEQARRLARRLQATPIDSVYSSPLNRAKTTAGVIAEMHQLPVNIINNLTEIEMGEWTNRGLDEIQQKWPVLLARWIADPAQVSLPGGENFNQVAFRSQQALATIVAANPERTVLVVTHEIVIKTLIMQSLEATFPIYRRFEIGNASLSHLRFEQDSPLVISINEKFHLAEHK